jgi:hypothetical protein
MYLHILLDSIMFILLLLVLAAIDICDFLLLDKGSDIYVVDTKVLIRINGRVNKPVFDFIDVMFGQYGHQVRNLLLAIVVPIDNPHCVVHGSDGVHALGNMPLFSILMDLLATGPLGDKLGEEKGEYVLLCTSPPFSTLISSLSAINPLKLRTSNGTLPPT